MAEIRDNDQYKKFADSVQDWTNEDLHDGHPIFGDVTYTVDQGHTRAITSNAN